MALLGFQTLKCPTCEKSHVIAAWELKWQEGKGQAAGPVGYYCLFCLKPFDTERAIRAIKSQELRDKIKELEGINGR